MLVSSLVLSLALMSDAEAGDRGGINGIRVIVQSPRTMSLTALTPDAAGEIAQVTAELDGEDVSLTESDAWVHGTASLGALPAEGAEVTLTVYDRESAALATFSGGYAEGELTLAPPRTGGEGECASRTGCEEGESSPTEVDLEVLAATVFADGTVGLDLAGADALSVASATLSVVESSPTEECVSWGRDGACIEWGVSLTRSDAEVDLDELGIVWEGEAVELDAVSEVEVTARDADGKKLDKVKLDLAPAWDDGGEGVNALPVDEDPLSAVALLSCEHGKYFGDDCSRAFAIASTGWTSGDDLPERALVELEGGETWEIPVNSYQLAQSVALDVALDTIEEVAVDGVTLARSAASADGRRRYVDNDLAVMVDIASDEAGTAWASLTTWAADPDHLPASATLSVDGSDAEVAFDDALVVVFATGLDVATDPHGLDLVGEVALQGEADARGKRKTLARGRFAGQLDTDGDGDLDLAAIDETGDTVSRGDILIGGEPIDIERTGAPPILALGACSCRMNAQLTTYR